jgi:hypothetical protein
MTWPFFRVRPQEIFIQIIIGFTEKALSFNGSVDIILASDFVPKGDFYEEPTIR